MAPQALKDRGIISKLSRTSPIYHFLRDSEGKWERKRHSPQQAENNRNNEEPERSYRSGKKDPEFPLTYFSAAPTLTKLRNVGKAKRFKTSGPPVTARTSISTTPSLRWRHTPRRKKKCQMNTHVTASQTHRDLVMRLDRMQPAV